jgi:excisionase family DNA binding protein
MSAWARCIGRRCSDGPLLDGAPGPRMAGRGLLCGRCAARMERHLSEVPARVTLLTAAVTPRRGGSGGRGSGSTPVPVDLGAHDHLREVAAVLGSWARLATEERGVRGPDRLDDAIAASRWLLSQVDWLVGRPWVDDLEDELHDLSAQADGIARVWPAWHGLEPPCPSCSARELGRRDGDERVHCRACGTSWDERQYRWLVLVLSADPSLSLTASEAAARLGVKVSTLRNWVSEGRIRKVGTVDGTARYSAADVEAARKDGAA